ncbi:THAP domain-containing protein 7-like, partial [Pezoporus wallicus]|uniref:THAP domain-containing protein 7-like n=1 Tax=Pezoporus wallicus TaxID=35540 RepID=UPI00254E20E9
GYHRLKEGAVPTLFNLVTPRPHRVKPPPAADPLKPLKGTRRWRLEARLSRLDPSASRLDPSACPLDPSASPLEPSASPLEPSASPLEPSASPLEPSASPLEPSASHSSSHPPTSPPFPLPISCFPGEPEGSAPAGDHGAVAALPGSSEARGPSPKPPPEAPGSGPVPPSPSLYVLRLPPRLGAYIQSEHSYQVGNALLWKRRAEAALEALGKAQRQLQACKRREQRLRLRVGELQRERRWDAREAAVKREDGDGGQ